MAINEANSVELFFDLFFVIGAANLATFTAYHSISDVNYLLAYIVFFSILWATWFQITLHDVRFARDSIYERICKTIQLITFFGIALVSSSFNLTDEKTNNQNFEVLCYILIISRGQLAVQHIVVLSSLRRARYSKLYLPLGFMIATYCISAGIFAGIIRFYRPVVRAATTLYMVWCGVLIAEAVVVITISCSWRMLSFKKTHLMERISLLTIIVIGEGAIGVSRSLGAIVRHEGLDMEGCFFIMCVVVILILIWALYFDNFPHGHYGTIRQQIWSLLHFPFQLAILGVVEGSQQIAMARYVLKRVSKSSANLHTICQQNLDSVSLRDALIEMVDKYSFKAIIDTYPYYDKVIQHIQNVGNSTGICSSQNATIYFASGAWPEDLQYIDNAIRNGVYSGLGVKMPIKRLDVFIGHIDMADKSWRLTYIYFWSCFCLLIILLVAFLLMIRRHKADLFDFVSVMIRCLVLGAGVASLAITANKNKLYSLLNSVAILPSAVAFLFIIICCDKLASVWCNWRLGASSQPYAIEV
ncbi:bacterial low temperature requirement A protein-domain-containing protein [Paraphoma chrysanthemicola]|uniref:Bacterial low temperature requirement A protein-domain-containing protein n=1 Tax=Paraphoma chrysanthemicola TaxID=798071 RepID=A0A8K0R694_9PLEO|nr:bacterial low temperature requirement A protein-domain-containing protein [Paraphoma chrysanthemicola]